MKPDLVDVDLVRSPHRPAGQIRWVNVWQDDDAAQFVADNNDGNVLTPTVMTGTGRRLPMTSEAIRSHLANQRAS